MSTATLDYDNITLSTDQQNALNKFIEFIADPSEQVFVLRGYSGCGKSTLVRVINDRLPALIKTIKLINPSAKDFTVKFTATTNKAAENLAQITGEEVVTIHSALGLRVQTDYKTNKTTLVPRNNFQMLERVILFVDEASTLDKELLQLVFTRTKDCKVVFVGDPAQLTHIHSPNAPVFLAGFFGAALEEVMRQPKPEGGLEDVHPITAFGAAMRNTVITGIWTPIVPDGFHIQRLDRDAFNAAVVEEFTRPDWRYSDSKILAWTNKCAISYNQFVRNQAKGDPHFQPGDYAVVNSFMQVGKYGLKTDQMVQITRIEPDSEHEGVKGNWITVDGSVRAFHPKSLAEKNAAIRQARNSDQLQLVAEMEERWFDLRAVYASTVDKAQGSTYDKVFIDLDDIGRCPNMERIARMLYVGPTRARHHVYLTGDLT